MRILTENQATQFYVANSLKTAVKDFTTAGDILVKATSDGSSIYFQQKGAGSIVRSDLIDVRNITYGKATAAKSLAEPLMTALVTLDPTVNEGNLIPGEDYILRLTFDGYVGISPEDSQYWKYGVVKAYKGMSTFDFYKKMAFSIVKNMSREAVKLVTIELQEQETGGTVVVTPTSKESDFGNVYNGILIKEVEPEWLLGTKQTKRNTFSVGFGEVLDDTDYKIWGKVEYGKSNETIKDGQKVADMEYFFMGERGDQYRMVGFPDYVPTKYLVDPTKEYDLINIHYFCTGSNESSQKSEKDIILAVPTSASNKTTNDIATAINALIKASGVTINTLT
jgi:hypothetical protein